MNRRTTLGIFLITLAVRLAFGCHILIFPEGTLANDTPIYRQLAEALTHGQFPSLFRTPGYPFFLALTGGFPHSGVTATLLAQMLLECLTAVLLARIAWHLFQQSWAAIGAGWLYAFCPINAVLSSWMVSESLSIFLVVAAFYLALCHTSRLSLAAQTGCWIWATMTRPSGLLLPLIVCFFLLIQSRQHLKRWKGYAAVLVVYFFFVGLWVGFNYMRSGMPVLCTNPTVSFYIYEVPAVSTVDQLSWLRYIRTAVFKPKEYDQLIEHYEKGFIEEAFPGTQPKPKDLWFTMDDAQTIRQLDAIAAERTKGRLSTLIGIHLVGALQTIRPKWNSSGIATRLLDVFRLSLLMVATAILVWKRQWWLLAFFGTWILYALILPGPVGSWRFRSMAEPVLSVGIAAALTPLLRHWLTSRRRGPLSVARALSLSESARSET